jgi:hypothetical protein
MTNRASDLDVVLRLQPEHLRHAHVTLTCPPSTAPLPERKSGGVANRGRQSRPRGKKELTEQITPELREVEVEGGRGKTVLEAVKKTGVSEQTYSDGRRSSGACGSIRRSGSRTLRKRTLG